MAPRWSRDGPRWTQGGPRWPQDGPKMAQDGPTMTPESSQMAFKNHSCLGVEDRGAVSKPTSDVAGVDELPESSRIRCRGGRYDSPLIMHVIRAETQCLVEQICAYITRGLDVFTPVCSNHSCNKTMGHGVRKMILQDTTRKPTTRMINQSLRRRRCLTPCPHQMPRIHGT